MTEPATSWNGRRLTAWLGLLGLIAMLGSSVAGAVPARDAAPVTGGTQAAPLPRAGTYVNPIVDEFAGDFPDPGIVQGKDGYWYAYATTTVLTRDNAAAGHDDHHFIPMSRSKDLVSWEYLGDVFGPDHHPTWAPFADTYYWAPDVRYVDGLYYLYYSVASYKPVNFTAIGVATAPTPRGPWTDSGAPVVERDPQTVVIDPALFVDSDGTRWMYYGSFGKGGIRVVRLNENGTRAVGESTMVVSEHRGEAPWVVKRDGYYYLFYSGFGCCTNTEGSYPVFAGRSKSPTGPFVDREGVSLVDPRPGGTIVNSPNGNSWTGTGHNAIVVDRAGQDWILLNSFDRHNPWGRPTVMDRLDWIDGWPTVRAGLWSSDTPQPAPVSRWDVGSGFDHDSDLRDLWAYPTADTGAWKLAADDDSGAHVEARSRSPRATLLVSRESGPADYRAEADLRVRQVDGGAAGLVFAHRSRDNYAVAWLDPGQRSLVVDVVEGGRTVATHSRRLHKGFSYGSWHSVVAEVRGGTAAIEVSNAQQGDPVTVTELRLPQSLTGASPVGVASRGGAGDADNVGIAALYEPVTEKAPDPSTGKLLASYSDEFEDDTLAPEWSWVGQPDGAETGGGYVWPTQDADLSGSGQPASVMLRDAPTGTYTVEAKLHLPLGVDTARNYAQAGLIAYLDRARSIHVAPTSVDTTRQAFLWIGRDRYAWPEMMLGPSADTLWLRLRHTVDAGTGEHLYRAATSRDGEHWVWGGVWALPKAEAEPRIGLVSMGGSGATATFDYVRVYAP